MSHISRTAPRTPRRRFAGLRSSGIRARFGYGWASAGGADQPHPRGMEAVREDLPADDEALVTMYAMLRGPALSSQWVTVNDLTRARALDLRSSFHVVSDLMPELRDVELLRNAGLLANDLTLIHCSTSSDKELKMIAEIGAGVSIAPGTETSMPGVGLPALGRMIHADIEPGLSVDIEVAAAGDLFDAMRTARTAESITTTSANEPGRDQEPLAPRRLLELATVRGAEVGSLSLGKHADVVLLDAQAVNLAPFTDPAESIVMAGHAGNVKAVFVAGRPLKLGGQLVDSERTAVEAARESRHRLLSVLRDSAIPDRGGGLELLE